MDPAQYSARLPPFSRSVGKLGLSCNLRWRHRHAKWDLPMQYFITLWQILLIKLHFWLPPGRRLAKSGLVWLVDMKRDRRSGRDRRIGGSVGRLDQGGTAGETSSVSCKTIRYCAIGPWLTHRFEVDRDGNGGAKREDASALRQLPFHSSCTGYYHRRFDDHSHINRRCFFASCPIECPHGGWVMAQVGVEEVPSGKWQVAGDKWQAIKK